MIKARYELIARIDVLLKNNIGEPVFCKEACDNLFKLYSIPYDISNDIITLRKSAYDYDDFILFAVLSVIREKELKKFFTDKEIEKYSTKQYSTKKIKFPIKFNMIEVSEDQWVGTISVRTLLDLRDARLINYNENAQRPLTHRTVNGEEYYQISINEKAVSGIMDSFKNGTYISNTITLNIPETCDFGYNDGVLSIRNISAFDILDGYHRYVAMQRLVLMNKDFDYTMELRIVCFPEEKAKQFIWQEDQKTKMSKIDSDSMNQNSISNQVVARLNQRNPFAGLINNNNAIIDAGILSRLITTYFCNDNKKKTRSDMITLSNKIYDYFNILVDNNPQLLDKKWHISYLVAAVQLIYMDIDEFEYPNRVDEFSKILSDPENEVYIHNFKLKQFRKTDINRLVRLYSEKR